MISALLLYTIAAIIRTKAVFQGNNRFEKYFAMVLYIGGFVYITGLLLSAFFLMYNSTLTWYSDLSDPKAAAVAVKYWRITIVVLNIQQSVGAAVEVLFNYR